MVAAVCLYKGPMSWRRDSFCFSLIFYPKNKQTGSFNKTLTSNADMYNQCGCWDEYKKLGFVLRSIAAISCHSVSLEQMHFVQPLVLSGVHPWIEAFHPSIAKHQLSAGVRWVEWVGEKGRPKAMRETLQLIFFVPQLQNSQSVSPTHPDSALQGQPPHAVQFNQMQYSESAL